MKKILLDTNAYAAFFTGDTAVLKALGRATVVYMSAIVLGELYAGFKGGKKEAENIRQLDAFLRKSTVQAIDVTQETAIPFGEIKNRLKKAGTPLPINDVWIAAHAAETGAVLITYDSHFHNIQGLRLWANLNRA